MRSAVKLIAGDLLAVAAGVFVAWAVTIVLAYRRAFGGIE